MRNKYSFILILLLIFFCSSLLKGQNSDDDYVHKDSVIKIEQIPEKKITNNGESDKKVIADSFLKANDISFSDSVEVLKKSPDFTYSKNLDSILKVLQRQERSEQKKVSYKSSWLETFFFSPVTKVFFWSLACLFIGFILHRLFFTEGFFQRRTLAANLTVLLQDDEHLNALRNYTKLIEQAVTNKNYRLAVRYSYLQTLQKLSAKGIIQFAVNKTNHQYVEELVDKSYKNEFARLTLIYEYTWYGKFDTDEVKFAGIQNIFKNFYNII